MVKPLNQLGAVPLPPRLLQQADAQAGTMMPMVPSPTSELGTPHDSITAEHHQAISSSRGVLLDPFPLDLFAGKLGSRDHTRMVHVLMESAQVHNECGSIGQGRGPNLESCQNTLRRHTIIAQKKRETPLGIPRLNALLAWVSAQSQRHSGVTTRTMSTNSPSSMSQVRESDSLGTSTPRPSGPSISKRL